MFQSRGIIVDQAHVFVQLAEEFNDAEGSGTAFTLIHPGGEDTVDLGAASSFGNVRQVSIPIDSEPGEWSLTVSGVGSGLGGDPGRLNPQAIEDIIFVLHFTVE
jgi:hypothetical protein